MHRIGFRSLISACSFAQQGQPADQTHGTTSHLYSIKYGRIQECVYCSNSQIEMAHAPRQFLNFEIQRKELGIAVCSLGEAATGIICQQTDGLEPDISPSTLSAIIFIHKYDFLRDPIPIWELLEKLKTVSVPKLYIFDTDKDRFFVSLDPADGGVELLNY